MKIYTSKQARSHLYALLDFVAEAHEPVYITGKRNTVVVISEEDFNATQETLCLLSIPGMREIISQGRQEPVEQCSRQLEW